MKFKDSPGSVHFLLTLLAVEEQFVVSDCHPEPLVVTRESSALTVLFFVPEEGLGGMAGVYVAIELVRVSVGEPDNDVDEGGTEVEML